MQELSKRPKSEEIHVATQEIVEQTKEGLEACDELELLIKATDRMSAVASRYRTKSKEAKEKLMELSTKL